MASRRRFSCGPGGERLRTTGTRLVARLGGEHGGSCAVVPAIELQARARSSYPAGSKAIGKPQQASCSGFVSLHFDTLELPDRTTEN